MRQILIGLFSSAVLIMGVGPWQLTAYGQSSPVPSVSPSPSPSLTPTESITTRTGSEGTYLTNGDGKSLYLSQGDNPDKSTCTGTCTTVWIPFTVPNGQRPQTSGEAQNSLVGLIQRDDGSAQVTYNHHPLYTYRLDILAGNTHGQGNSNFGSNWYLVQPNGNAIMPSPTPSASPSLTR